MTRLFALFALALASLAVACAPIEPDAACAKKANTCDLALDEPFGSFAEDDQTFGVGGTCWQNDETAKACIAECDAFVAEQLEAAQLKNNKAQIVACGGKVE